MIKTRYAPSPTGEQHIGGARTALFAYLFAKSKGGEFLLRMEDTDRARFVEGSDDRIIESLKWLGIVPDNVNNVVYQSKRLDIYKKYVLKLLLENKAYICTCSKERLEELRKEQEAKKLPTGYDGHCRKVGSQSSTLREEPSGSDSNEESGVRSAEELDILLAKGAVVRMKMPEKGLIVVEDMVRGHVEFDAELLDDQVIMKSDGFPTYHFAHVVDDHEMGITHVIRAEEWLPSTPKHVVLNEMLGFKIPEYAHLSMILPPDKKGKLSKRHGAVSVMDFKTAGYLPEALVNFIAFLGWNPKTEKEDYTLDELIAEFRPENLNKAPAIFDRVKLDNINEKYLKEAVKSQPACSSSLSLRALPSESNDRTGRKSKVKKLLSEFGVEDLTEGEMQLLSRGGFKTLKEMADEILKLRKKTEYAGTLLVFKKSTKINTEKGLALALEVLDNIEAKEWNSQEIQMKLGLAVTNNDLTNGDLFWPVRVALSGEERSPSPVELLMALGKEESIKRIKSALKKIQ